MSCLAILEVAHGHWDLGDATTMMEQATRVKDVLEEYGCTHNQSYAEGMDCS